MSTIARSEAWRYEWRLLENTGTLAPLDATSTVRCWLSATFKGDAIAPSTIPLARGASGLRTDGRELWAGVLDAGSVGTALAGIATGDSVYEVCEVNGERKCAALTVAD